MYRNSVNSCTIIHELRNAVILHSLHILNQKTFKQQGSQVEHATAAQTVLGSSLGHSPLSLAKSRNLSVVNGSENIFGLCYNTCLRKCNNLPIQLLACLICSSDNHVKNEGKIRSAETVQKFILNWTDFPPLQTIVMNKIVSPCSSMLSTKCH